MKYFILNKQQDFENGKSYHLKFDESGIWMDSDKKKKYAVFISKLYDTRESETNWSHMSVDMKEEKETSICISFYATEQREQKLEGNLIDIHSTLISDKVSLTDKLHWMKPYLKKSVSDASEVLLHEIKARYLWFVIEFYRQGEKSPKINSILIYFPKQTWIHYLPEVYQSEHKSGSFLERYLSVFQLLYEDMNQKIKNTPSDYDPESALGSKLDFISHWLDGNESYIWTEEKKRIILKNAVKFYKVRGTVKSIEEILTLYLGETPYIVEYHELEAFKKEKDKNELLSKLYGDNPFSFTVIMRENNSLTNKEYNTVLELLNDVKPAYMEAHIVVIRPYIFLDSYSYLGINSSLGSYRASSLDEFSMMPFTVI